MSKLPRTAESIALVGAILISVTIWSSLGADEGDAKPHDCPFCGTKGVTFDNTPEGAFQKMKLAVAGCDANLLRECVVGMDDAGFEKMTKRERWDVAFGRLPLKGCHVDGDKATIETAAEGRAFALAAVRDDGVWKIDMASLRNIPISNSARDSDCVNNLRMLGTYIVMYVSKYGNDRDFPGPGQRLLSDLFTLPDAPRAIGRGVEVILTCKRAGDEGALDRLKNGEWDAMSYECWEGQVSDARTPPDAPIAWDKTPCHDGKRNVLFFSGSVSRMTEEELGAALQRHPE